ncbi:pyridoxal 5'-phosphate synthase glutaminase subunit PdxT [Candidatus Woesearchaeota archaeon]|nr:pyridoxal 5'-phosphate synthase glutaminase subunit PdxT [Candidatus Woesearchaeota archaeon]
MIGVLALQGGVIEHVRMLERCGKKAIEVRAKDDLKKVNALILPGGESTTLFKLMKRQGLDTEIKKRAKKGMPVFGTCAGMIVLAKEIIDNREQGLGLIDISVKRNDYGRQVDSFEEEIDVRDIGKVNAVFIRAPIVKSCGKDVEVLARQNKNPILLKQNNILVASFHPELTDDKRVHELFLKMNSII